MALRNRHKIGDYLVMDDESGLVIYKSEAVKIWDGTWRKKSMYETRQPQEFVEALNDPQALTVVRPEPNVDLVNNIAPIFVGDTTVPAPTDGPAYHLYNPFDTGIGDMVIEESFIVR